MTENFLHFHSVLDKPLKDFFTAKIQFRIITIPKGDTEFHKNTMKLQVLAFKIRLDYAKIHLVLKPVNDLTEFFPPYHVLFQRFCQNSSNQLFLTFTFKCQIGLWPKPISCEMH